MDIFGIVLLVLILATLVLINGNLIRLNNNFVKYIIKPMQDKKQ